jgi:hypothetical protein
MEEFVGKRVITTITTLQKGEKDFEVTLEVAHSRSTDAIVWQEKTIAMKAFGKTMEEAYEEVVTQVGKYLESVQGDLFTDEQINSTETQSTKFDSNKTN